MSRVGILGGTFDPIHNGHIVLSKEAINTKNLDEIIIIPSGNPPHKFANRVTPAVKRLAMLHLVFDKDPRFSIWEGELGTNGYSFAVDSIEKLKSERPNDSFFYILGTDSASRVTTWKNYDYLKTLCGFLIAKRIGDGVDVRSVIEDIEKTGGTADIIMAEDFIEVSSSEFRDAIRNNDDLAKKLVPPEVFSYIKENDLYHDGPCSFGEIEEDLKEVLTEEKYIHSLGVSEEAERLARIFNADVEKCKLAGLLHDCAKCVKMSQLQWIGKTIEDFGADVPFNGVNRRVVHGQLGAYVAEKRYGVTDPVVLDAIANHVTGKPQMSLESMIIFLADYTEKNREGEFFENMRRVIKEEGLLKAVVTSCDGTIKLIADRGEEMDIRTIQTRNWAVGELRKLDNK